jgi:hypothetical protein
MFYHYFPVKKVEYIYKGNTFGIEIFKAEEDGHLNGYLYCGELSDSIAMMKGDVAYDININTDTDIGENAADMLIEIIKNEIDAGKYIAPKTT